MYEHEQDFKNTDLKTKLQKAIVYSRVPFA